MDKQEAWDYLTENGIATEEELQLVTGTFGYTLENLTDVCYYRTGEYLPDDEDDDETEEDDEEFDVIDTVHLDDLQGFH